VAPTINIVPSYHPTAQKYIPKFADDFGDLKDIFWVATVYDTSKIGFFLDAFQLETGVGKTSKIVTKKIGNLWVAAIGMKHDIVVVKSNWFLELLINIGLLRKV
jgi:hypothetical protein